MAKIRKAVFRSGIVMLSLLAAIVLSSSVAYAQECLATAKSNTVRAEGRTEVVGDINLRCRIPEAKFGVDSSPLDATDNGDDVMSTITVELNADITNEATAEKVEFVAADDLGYAAGGINLSAVELTAEGALDTGVIDIPATIMGSLEDSTTIEWEIANTLLDLVANNDDGFSLTIKGIRVDASAVGAGEDVTAIVSFNDTAVHSTPRKVSDVTTGLVVEVDAASGLQCVAEEQTATILIKEGFKSAFTADHSFTLTFRNIPENVMVKPGRTQSSGDADALRDDKADLAEVMIQEGTTSGLDEDGYVELTATGTGEVTYDFEVTEAVEADANAVPPVVGVTATAYEANIEEWLTLEVTFKWKAGTVPLSSESSVIVSFAPVSTTKLPSFVVGPSMSVLEVEDCTTSLVFPFVTNMYGYETGVAITNTSSEGGMCMLSFSGMEDDMEVMVMAESVTTFGVSMMAPGFQGFIEAECEFREGKGFAFITNGFGTMGGPTAAQGYLVADDSIAESD
jgi:hypothetical protein